MTSWFLLRLNHVGAIIDSHFWWGKLRPPGGCATRKWQVGFWIWRSNQAFHNASSSLEDPEIWMVMSGVDLWPVASVLRRWRWWSGGIAPGVVRASSNLPSLLTCASLNLSIPDSAALACCVASGKVPASLSFEPICKKGVVTVPSSLSCGDNWVRTASRILSSVLGFQGPAVYSCFILLFVLSSLVMVITAKRQWVLFTEHLNLCLAYGLSHLILRY